MRWFAFLFVFVIGAPALAKPAPRQPAQAKRAPLDLRSRRAMALPAAPEPSANTVVAQNEREHALAQHLDNILSSPLLKSAMNGVYVVDARSGRELYAHAADRQLNPASNTKLVSTAAAFARLGPDFAYPTRLVGLPADEEGVVHGDVQLVGSADPTLGSSDLRDLAHHLAATGIRKITGSVLVSTDERDALAHAWVDVTVIGGDKEGEHAHVRVSPDSTYFVVDNMARTAPAGRGKRRPGVSVDTRVVERKDGERLQIVVSGRVRAGQAVEVSRGVSRPSLFAAHTLRAAILSSGIEIDGGARQVRSRPDDDQGGLVELARHDSVPLARLAAMINKPSNNFLADRLITTVAAEVLGERTMAAGVRIMSEWLASIGIGGGTYRFENGSGLSHTIHVSARQIAQVLLAGARDERIGQAWLASLAVGGRDGTLRSRFAGHPVAGYVVGKTGTLNGVSALSGFVNIGGRSVCFAMLTNGFRERRKPDVRHGQAAIVDAIFGYLAEGNLPSGQMPVEAADADGEVDSEDVAPIDDHAEGRTREIRGGSGVDL